MTEDDVLRAQANAQEFDRYKQPWQTVEDEQISEALWAEYARLKESFDTRAAQHIAPSDSLTQDITVPSVAPQSPDKARVNFYNGDPSDLEENA